MNTAFNGQYYRQRKVDLRGKSKELSKEEILAKARQDKERRRRHQLETSSAVKIQAVFRSWRSRKTRRAELWAKLSEVSVSELPQLVTSPAAWFLPALLFCVDARNVCHVHVLARTCYALLHAHDAAGALLFCKQQGANARAIMLHRACKLTQLCLRCLVINDAFVPPLSSLRSVPPQQHCQQPEHSTLAYLQNTPASAADVATIVDCAVTLSSAATWQPPHADISNGGSMVANYLVDHALMVSLHDVAIACIQHRRSTNAAGSSGGGNSRRDMAPLFETLVSSLTQCAVNCSSNDAQNAIAAAAAVNGDNGMRCRNGFWMLLTVPLLWIELPTLVPLQHAVLRHAARELHGMQHHQLAALLPSNARVCKGASVTALTANIMQAGPSTLSMQSTPSTSRLQQSKVTSGGNALGVGSTETDEFAMQYFSLLHTLLDLLPMAALFPEAYAQMDVDGDDTMQPSTSSAHALPWSSSWQPSGALVEMVDFRRDHAQRLLRHAVQLLLRIDHRGGGGGMTEKQMSAAQALCNLLLQVLQLRMMSNKDVQTLLLSLAEFAQLVQRLWFSLLLPLLHADTPAMTSSNAMTSSSSTVDGTARAWMAPLILLCRAYSSFLGIASIDDMYVVQKPLSLSELYDSRAPNQGLVATLRRALWQVLWLDKAQHGDVSVTTWQLRKQLMEAAGQLYGKLFDRNMQRAFAPVEAFHAEGFVASRFQQDVEQALAFGGGRLPSPEASRVAAVLRYSPALIPFYERAVVFNKLVSSDRQAAEDSEMESMMTRMTPNRFVRIRRDHVLEDAYTSLNKLAHENLKSRIRVQFIDAHGIEEVGIDGGGLFKDFMECLVKGGFDPQLGLFKTTVDNNIYPNPAAPSIIPDAYQLWQFLGRMVAKAMYENILIEIPFARFFLTKLRFGARAGGDVNDLPSLDPELYRNLMSLKSYSGDAADLSLTMTVSVENFGSVREEELVPGGSGIMVTSANALQYIHLVAHYKLNKQIAPAAAAFIAGFNELIDHDWVRMFNEDELSTLIRGSGTGINVADMASHTNYAGGYHEEHPTILEFWQAVESMSGDEQRLLLKFITACSRAPLLGFAHLEPKLCIQMAGSVLDPNATARFPTASTCMNLLKLPPYRGVDVMKQKLLYAITSASGFDLS